MSDLTITDDTVLSFTDTGGMEVKVEFGENTHYLTVTLDLPDAVDPEFRPFFMLQGRHDADIARQLGRLLMQWADDWQSETDRFTYAPPCGINVHPDAKPNPDCGGDHDEDGVCR